MATQPPTHRNLSRQDWIGPANSYNIDTGSLQRIADALETHLPIMAKRHKDLIEDNDRLNRLLFRANDNIATLLRRNAALRGQITKLKRKLATNG